MTQEQKRIPGTKKRAWAEIDLNHAAHNFRAIRDFLDTPETKLCCVIKANGYGHCAVELARLYQKLDADYLAVSNIEEALQLRRAKISLPILILGYTSCDCAQILADNDITQCVFSAEYGRELSKQASACGRTVKIHIKLDTGMGRIGFACRGDGEDEITEAVEVCKAPGLLAEGVFTHFAVSDEGEDGAAYTKKQADCFVRAIERMRDRGVEFAIRHCANSAAIFAYPEYRMDMVRAGVVLFGLSPSEKIPDMPELIPVMSLHSVISHIKTLYPGQSVSYGRVFTADRQMQVATVPIGYADGFPRRNGQNGYCLLVRGKPAPIVGRVCMDQLMIDVSGIECRVGDDVTVFGAQEPATANTMARLNDTINYEIICDVGERIPRAFVSDGKIIGWKDDILGE